MTSPQKDDAIAATRDDIESGRTALGIEFGSTRIKACLIGPDHAPIADASSDWENQFVDGVWTYSLDAVWAGVQDCVAGLIDDVQQRYGTQPTTFGAIGVSAMMHGYLAFDADDELLVPFRTWRNTGTGAAAAELTELFGGNIPHRWSVAHLYQAVLDDEPHVPRIAHLTTLAGYVHWKLTGRNVLGVGDASGMFPIDPVAKTYDPAMVTRFDELISSRHPGFSLEAVLPQVLVAGQDAGRLTAEGAVLLAPSGRLQAGIPLCPPEGDAGTGMVATNAVSPRTGNVSAGTSIFAMVVLESPLAQVHPELDLVTTPTGELVAMVHCNNGASELGAWAALFGEFATALGHPADADTVFNALVRSAVDGDADGGGLLAYNYLSGEPITGLDAGRPLFVRTPDSRLTLANFIRTQIYAAFATLAIGMRVLAGEDVRLDTMFAHGGLFRTPGVGQQMLAAAIGAPVAVGRSAGEGGAWGAAVLAAYLPVATEHDLTAFLRDQVFNNVELDVCEPDPNDVAGFATYLERFSNALPLERAASQLI
jgi:sugar (pentulose or hexulose) kinase